MLGYVVCASVLCVQLVHGYYVAVSGDEKLVIDGTGQYRAEVFDDEGNDASGSFLYTWQDNAVPQHYHQNESTSHISYWNVTYPITKYAPGPYNIQVVVKRWNFVYYEPIASQRMTINVTLFLNGDLTLSQGNQTRRQFVSNTETVNHEIFISSADEDFLNRTKMDVRSYWFVDCVYNGEVKGLNFLYNYSDSEVGHYIESLVVGSHDVQPPTLPPPTISPNTSTNSTVLDHNDVGTVEPNHMAQWLSTFPTNSNSSQAQSRFCVNTSVIPFNMNNTYGYFRTNFTVKAPIKISPMNGTNWLMDGSILNITLSCNGSSPYQYCVLLKSGLYNVTGDETCSWLKTIRNCTIRIEHLFKEPAEYTVVVILINEVSKIVKPIAVNVYKVTKHPQLSVIIVPVTFSFLAVVLVIFGVAYYLQSRRSYTIEVANFDFGNQANDMEYKTFRERLKDSVTNSFFTSQDPPDNENVWSPSRKYGSMQ